MNTEVNPDMESKSDVRILRKGQCPSLSGKSKLSYNLGSDSTGQIHFQVIGNDGGGKFNDDWVPQSSIQAVLDKLPQGKELTSGSFRAIYPQKSTNSPGFLLAVLKDVGLVQASKDKARCYELLDPAAFIAEVNALLESAPDARKTLTLKPKKMASS